MVVWWYQHHPRETMVQNMVSEYGMTCLKHEPKIRYIVDLVISLTQTPELIGTKCFSIFLLMSASWINFLSTTGLGWHEPVVLWVDISNHGCSARFNHRLTGYRQLNSGHDCQEGRGWDVVGCWSYHGTFDLKSKPCHVDLRLVCWSRYICWRSPDHTVFRNHFQIPCGYIWLSNVAMDHFR